MSTSHVMQLEPATEQLSLFPSAVPERFRLDEATRRRGIRHAAAIKARLEARYPSTPRSEPPGPGQRTRVGERAPGHAA